MGISKSPREQRGRFTAEFAHIQRNTERASEWLRPLLMLKSKVFAVGKYLQGVGKEGHINSWSTLPAWLWSQP